MSVSKFGSNTENCWCAHYVAKHKSTAKCALLVSLPSGTLPTISPQMLPFCQIPLASLNYSQVVLWHKWPALMYCLRQYSMS